ncbi:MAG: hypothetical protein IT481_16090 [Gammaproteobacteria bacterium]|nr:hypothetical protein [Gammaproteobacteria bacterium]
MTQQELSKARNPDLRASLAAMQRVAKQARQIAIQTRTAIIVVEGGILRRVPAEELQRQIDEESAK